MPTYLALHYWAGSGREFELLLPHLPAGSRLLAPDLPGFGAPVAPAGFDYSVASYADWVVHYLAEQQVADYQIIGHSMSGKIALALAARQPAGLRGLLLLSPSPPTPEPISDADRAASLAAYGKPEEAEKTFHKITNQPLPAEWHERVVADNLRTTQAAWDAWLQSGSREDISALMPQVQVPCRLLVGENDRAIPPDAQRRQTLPLLPPGSPLVVVPGAGHLLPLEAPEVVARELVG
ncbi:alpha/beta hydrolase [Hymenobacter sp. UV11]|uniref:alpha/beta fold hydrolase n=1 Tax=Hymenobacter sp. UV11 TaxID=1849735 RepID=UPI00105DE9EA|nr:alpha/beta hydrolase [Hymenobacter sp. UV11]TDN38986.1 hypothetical protein A8B98_21025 [Hymenobacter sp. UV11]TFZ65931.1 alpha/beta hydrolase [Hymenobacter sp. UV11]